MKIGLDLVNLRGLDGGVARYATQLISGISNLDQINNCVLFINSAIADQINADHPKFQKIVVHSPRRKYLPSNQLYFLLGRKLRGIDLLHSPVSVSPLFCRTRTVLTVHDLAYELFPEYYSKTAILYWRFALRRACHKASHVLTVSESTKRDLVRFMGVPERKVKVVYPCVSLVDTESSPEIMAHMRNRYSLPEKYVLYVGALHPRKNLETLVKAFSIAKANARFPHKLVLAGTGWAIESILGEIARCGMQDEVILTGALLESDLPLIYRGADVLVFPSHYEGFGYPPLEAMACGTPVIVSNTSSLPEVVGDTGWLVDPADPDDIAEKIVQVLLCPNLAEEMRSPALERSQQFSMNRMMTGIMAVYEEALSDPRH